MKLEFYTIFINEDRYTCHLGDSRHAVALNGEIGPSPQAGLITVPKTQEEAISQTPGIAHASATRPKLLPSVAAGSHKSSPAVITRRKKSHDNLALGVVAGSRVK